MDMERMSKEQLEEFVGAELAEIGANIYATKDGKFSVKHVNYVKVEGISDPSLDPMWEPGYHAKVTDRPFSSSSKARAWLKQAYKLYEFLEQFEETMGRRGQYQKTVIRRRLERMSRKG